MFVKKKISSAPEYLSDFQSKPYDIHLIFTNLSTNSLEQNPSWEPNIHSAIQ